MTALQTMDFESMLQKTFERVCQEAIEREMPRMVEEFKRKLAMEVGAASVAVFKTVRFERFGANELLLIVNFDPKPE